ncbi:MAG: hypothetical protein H6698_00590 [Myxococcales bacterium]|nr:hypothetical protein [Myxococcales bacterium]MCB9531978.1 hypothetical protein [Myxococcales bacterium]MCB9532809.1 hypothetical protein [Myxococcales bacterium]
MRRDEQRARGLRRKLLPLALAGSLTPSCGPAATDEGDVGAADVGVRPDACSAEPGLGALIATARPENRADGLVLYELQVRSANACDPDIGSDDQRARCAAQVGPFGGYRATDSVCAAPNEYTRIRGGTLQDLLTDSDDFEVAISLRYVAESVGANAVWLMPVFPNNDTVRLPDPCDNLGSPYASTDYFHIDPNIDADCVASGDTACRRFDAIDAVLDRAHELGLGVFLDVAFNHFGHGYRYFDTAAARPTRALGDEALGAAWDFEATFDPALLNPVVIDTEEAVQAVASADPDAARDLEGLTARCPGLSAAVLPSAFALWRVAFDDERERFNCDGPPLLAATLPAHYVAGDARPATVVGALTSAYGWRDVDFLYHRVGEGHDREAARTRDLVFRALNFWVARGVDGFRLDHATDALSGMSAETWRYVTSKVAYYAALRGQRAPIWLAEEFDRPDEMSGPSDIVTEGYLFEMLARGRPRGAAEVEAAVSRTRRFGDDARVLTALETHDELRLVTDTGLDAWTGLGFWSAGAATRSVPMLLMGQEFGESARLAFRRSHYLPARFVGTPQHRDDARALIAAYRAEIEVRRAEAGGALRGSGSRALRAPGTSAPYDGVVATLRWDDAGRVAIVLNNLYWSDAAITVAIPSDARIGVGLAACDSYRVRDLLGAGVVVPCTSASRFEAGVRMWLPAERRVIWGAVERCE